MTMPATVRKMKRSFTLTPDVVAFVCETRLKRGAGSDSEALDLLLREAMLEARRKQIDAAYQSYYDTATDEELLQQEEWAEMAGPSVLADMESAEAHP